MSKTEVTKQLEDCIYKSTQKMGVFGCFEVTIGFGGRERVDYMTYDTKGIFRCYEIKCTKSDFYSKAKKSFIGNYNYYVLTKELYEEVKEDIPKHVGIYVFSELIKKPQKIELQIDKDILKDSMIRSLAREQDKFRATCDIEYINKLKNKIKKKEKQYRGCENKRIAASNVVYILEDKYNLNALEVREIKRQNGM